MSLIGQPTEDTMKTVGARLREGRKMRGMTQTDLAKLIRTSPNQVSMIENGQSGTTIRTMVAAANALNVSLDFLAGLIEDPRPSRKLLFDLSDARSELWDLKHGNRGKVPAHYDGSTHIEVIDIRTAAGAGSVVHSGEGVKSMIAFPVAWLRERDLQPKNCRVIEVVGESMEPTLADGCSILIDLSRSTPYSKRNVRVADRRRADRKASRERPGSWMAARQRQPGQRDVSQPTVARRDEHPGRGEVAGRGLQVGSRRPAKKRLPHPGEGSAATRPPNERVAEPVVVDTSLQPPRLRASNSRRASSSLISAGQP